MLETEKQQSTLRTINNLKKAADIDYHIRQLDIQNTFLELVGGKWKETRLDLSKEHIFVYDYINNEMKFKGYGQY